MLYIYIGYPGDQVFPSHPLDHPCRPLEQPRSRPLKDVGHRGFPTLRDAVFPRNASERVSQQYHEIQHEDHLLNVKQNND